MTTAPVDRYFPEWTIADRLRRIRRDTGLTQAAFAERLQVGEQRYSAWESGRNHPPVQDFVTVEILRATGGDLRTTQRAARHASPATTAVYTLVADETLMSAVCAIPGAA